MYVQGVKELYRNLEIHHLLCKSAHLIVEAESVFALLFRREDEVALSFFLTFHDNLVIGTDHAVIDIERAASLDLFGDRSINTEFLTLVKKKGGIAHGEIKGQLQALLLSVGKETSFLVGL